jgi:hypothetical protein
MRKGGRNASRIEPMRFKRSMLGSSGIVTSVLFTCQTRPAPVGSDEQNQ